MPRNYLLPNALWYETPGTGSLQILLKEFE